MPKPIPSVIIRVEGGLIRHIMSDSQVFITILDYDTDAYDDITPVEIPREDGDISPAVIAYNGISPLINPFATRKRLKEIALLATDTDH